MRIVSPPAATTYAFMPLPHQPVNQLHSTARRGLRLVALALLLLAAPRMAQAAPNVAPSFVLGNTVVAWGYNGYGQTTVPAGLSGVSAIAAGEYHTVAVKADGSVVAWGYNGYGQTTVPAGLSGVTAIAAGDYHTVALKANGSVVAWGRNSEGQTNVPAGLSGVTAIAAGSLF